MDRKPFFRKPGLAIVLLILGIGLYYSFVQKQSSKLNLGEYTKFPGYEEERLALEAFVNQYFIEDGFFRTNLTDSEQRENASGEDILSESVGLLMLYHLKRDEPEKFEIQVNILTDHFMNSNRLVKWRIRRGSNQETVNATIDDLRIVKALIRAAEKWKKNEYEAIAKGLSTQLLMHSITKDNLKSYDSPDSPKAPFVYYDFEAMQLMEQFDTRWNKLSDVNMENILNHQVKGLPFYEDEWFTEDEGFPTIENLMIMMHLSEVGIKDYQSLSWLKRQLKQRGLYGSYSAAGKPLNAVESPAIYAIAACIAKLNNDEELYYLAVKRLKNMQNLESNEFYGGFIDLNRLSAFSFDQLFSLLAY
ncbi:glycosyl hydrolase family 8 [Petroclostridium sp. X23]|uniref:glycosyl hydrolase family 8 n=1 Tax=Petroclostridium sp. X23 TaxID=3045146 RepID=UPI0024ACD00C|nr:glycosyl hydrolase family 8 [Petroclostridium sp. X23]WHH58621.1 glycosyl hydrolase family 8 [Petroclostridium sp. X23]